MSYVFAPQEYEIKVDRHGLMSQPKEGDKSHEHQSPYAEIALKQWPLSQVIQELPCPLEPLQDAFSAKVIRDAALVKP